MSLADKLRKAREIRVETHGFTFIALRPKEMEIVEIVKSKDQSVRIIMPFIIGWENVKEMDMMDGGDPHLLKFDAEACEEWLGDRADLYGDIMKQLSEAVLAHEKKIEEAQKNSGAGLS